MKGKVLSRIRPIDIAVVAAVLFLALAIWVFPIWFADDGDTVCLTIGDGTEYISISNDTRREITSNGITLTLCIENGEVWIEESSCPDGVCVNSGKISRQGEIIVCAPAAVSVRIFTGGDIDAIL